MNNQGAVNCSSQQNESDGSSGHSTTTTTIALSEMDEKTPISSPSDEGLTNLEGAPLLGPQQTAIDKDPEDFVYTIVPEFVPSWEGIRGIAVALTCWCHIENQGYALDHVTGRSGVAIFFVLSGYLITGNLLKLDMKYNQTRIFPFRHLPKFYVNRFIRLYPALCTSVLVTAAFGLVILPKGDFHIRMGFWPALTYSSIYLLYDYQTIWWNMWSLCVEEQFYLIWSLILPVIFLTGAWTRRSIILSLLIASYTVNHLRIIESTLVPAALKNYYNLPTSIWRILAGALLRITPMPQWAQCRIWPWVGFLLLATSISITLMLGDAHHLRLQMLSHEPIAVLAAIMMINGSLKNNLLLETSGLRFLGRISFSVYLYQFPLWILSDLKRGFLGLGITSMAVIMGAISTNYVEEPVRRFYRQWQNGERKA